MRKKKYAIFLSLVLFSLLLTAQKRRITLELIYTQPYCGGARPTIEMQEEAEKPRPYANRKMILISSKGKVDTVMTDDNGVLKFKAKRGKYALLEPWRYYKRTFSYAPNEQFDAGCLEKEWKKETCSITVTWKEAAFEFKNELIEFCDWSIPCLKEAHAPPIRE